VAEAERRRTEWGDRWRGALRASIKRATGNQGRANGARVDEFSPQCGENSGPRQGSAVAEIPVTWPHWRGDYL